MVARVVYNLDDLESLQIIHWTTLTLSSLAFLDIGILYSLAFLIFWLHHWTFFFNISSHWLYKLYYFLLFLFCSLFFVCIYVCVHVCEDACSHRDQKWTLRIFVSHFGNRVSKWTLRALTQLEWLITGPGIYQLVPAS